MERLFKNFEFINEMDEDLDELFDNFLTEVNNKIYEKLLENYPDYKRLIKKKCDLTDEIFKDDKLKAEQINEIRTGIENPIINANFLLGIRLGQKLR